MQLEGFTLTCECRCPEEGFAKIYPKPLQLQQLATIIVGAELVTKLTSGPWNNPQEVQRKGHRLRFDKLRVWPVLKRSHGLER